MAGLVGRDAAVAMLRRHADESRAGRGRFVLIDGEPGIGKTALAGVAADDAGTSGALLAWGVCVSGEGWRLRDGQVTYFRGSEDTELTAEVFAA